MSWIITETEVAGQMVPVTVEAPNYDFKFQSVIGYTVGESVIPEAILSYLQEHESTPSYLFVINLIEVESGGANVFTISASESVFKSIDPSASPNGEFIVFNSSDSNVVTSKGSKGKVKCV